MSVINIRKLWSVSRLVVNALPRLFMQKETKTKNKRKIEKSVSSHLLLYFLLCARLFFPSNMRTIIEKEN